MAQGRTRAGSRLFEVAAAHLRDAVAAAAGASASASARTTLAGVDVCALQNRRGAVLGER